MEPSFFERSQAEFSPFAILGTDIYQVGQSDDGSSGIHLDWNGLHYPLRKAGPIHEADRGHLESIGLAIRDRLDDIVISGSPDFILKERIRRKHSAGRYDGPKRSVGLGDLQLRALLCTQMMMEGGVVSFDLRRDDKQESVDKRVEDAARDVAKGYLREAGLKACLVINQMVYSARIGPSGEGPAISDSSSSYPLTFSMPFSLFVDNYKDYVKKRIESVSETMMKEHHRRASGLAAEKELMKTVSRIDWDYVSYAKGVLGSAGYEMDGSGVFHFRAMIEPYMIQHGSSRYCFDGLSVGMDLAFVNRSAVLLNKPSVEPDCLPYHHPFVFDDGSICFGDEYFSEGSNRWRELGISFNTLYDRSWNTAQKVAVALDQAIQVIERGYIGSVTPVNDLNKKDFNEELAGCSPLLAAARIPPGRIFRTR